MRKEKKTVILKDGYEVTKNNIILNLNKDRHYSISKDGNTLIRNLLYKEVASWLRANRNSYRGL